MKFPESIHELYVFSVSCKFCKSFLAWSSTEKIEACCNNCMIRITRVNLAIGRRGNYQ